MWVSCGGTSGAGPRISPKPLERIPAPHDSSRAFGCGFSNSFATRGFHPAAKRQLRLLSEFGAAFERALTATYLVSCTLAYTYEIFRGEVAERLKAAVC